MIMMLMDAILIVALTMVDGKNHRPRGSSMNGMNIAAIRTSSTSTSTAASSSSSTAIALIFYRKKKSD